MTTAANGQSITTSDTTVSIDPACTTFAVHCLTTSAAPVLVNVGGLHDSGEFARVNEGDTQLFRLAVGGISTVTLKTASGTATVDYWVAVRL